MERVVRAFLEDAPVRLAELRRGVSSADAAAVSMAAHTLKGGCSYVGATRMWELCERLELTAERGDLSGAATQLAAIETEIEALSAALRMEISGN